MDFQSHCVAAERLETRFRLAGEQVIEVISGGYRAEAEYLIERSNSMLYRLFRAEPSVTTGILTPRMLTLRMADDVRSVHEKFRISCKDSL